MQARTVVSFASLCVLVGTAYALPNSPKDMLGSPAPAAAADRVITITPTTRHVNVRGGETVTFVSGGSSTTWSFDNPDMWAARLSEILPPGALDREILVYVGRNPIDSP
jgi:hypothetical protein